MPLCFFTASFSVLSSSVVHLPACAVVSLLLECRALCHLLRHCCFVRPGTSAAISAQFSPLFYFTSSVSVMSSSVVHLPARAVVSSLLETKILFHLLRHCFLVRPGTSFEIAAQSSPLCFFSASVSALSSSVVHLHARAIVSSLLESNTVFHLP
jgi:hypothetical protein